jgi:branched-subunit amino acid aminotransferase/4-amino-4-deoxychorismate lyase
VGRGRRRRVGPVPQGPAEIGRVEERPLLDAEARTADELFITSTTREISWVSHWDGHRVRTNTAGDVTMRLHRALKERIKQGGSGA